MKCPECGHTSWATYHGSEALLDGGLTVRCESSKNGLDVCGFEIHLTADQVVEAAFLVTQLARIANRVAKTVAGA